MNGKEVFVREDTDLSVFVVDPGGRGHATTKEFLKSDKVSTLYTSNAAASLDGGGEKVRHFQHQKDPDQLFEIIKACNPDLAVILPEAPLAAGLVNRLEEIGIPAFGARQEHAWLEANKAETKKFLHELGVPVANFRIYSNYEDAKQYVISRKEPLVVKASGLAEGKGSIVCDDTEGALLALKRVALDKEFGSAGETVVIEDRLFGVEQSVTVWCGGNNQNDYEVLPMTRDYKQRYSGNVGPNTGGMGSHSPSGYEDNIFSEEKVKKKIIEPIVKGILAKTGKPYVGVLYPGIMWVHEGGEWNPYVLEINIRPGDPEWQVIAPRFDGDLAEFTAATINGRRGEVNVKWREEKYLTVCMVSGKVPKEQSGGKGNFPGYPGKYKINQRIGLPNDFPETDGHILHSGTRWVCEHGDANHSTPCGKGFFTTTGGRVLGVVGRGKDLAQARGHAYQLAKMVSFPYMDYRHDIGDPDLLKKERDK